MKTLVYEETEYFLFLAPFFGLTSLREARKNFYSSIGLHLLIFNLKIILKVLLNITNLLRA